MASVVGAVPAVREHLLSLQRRIAQENDIIMDGRDIGTCILSNADVKIFLTASAEERARRRHLELQSKAIIRHMTLCLPILKSATTVTRTEISHR